MGYTMVVIKLIATMTVLRVTTSICIDLVVKVGSEDSGNCSYDFCTKVLQASFQLRR